MKITSYRIEKFFDCLVHHLKQGDGVYWSFKLAFWWFHKGFNFEGDN
jgi:hypothetical protein